MNDLQSKLTAELEQACQRALTALGEVIAHEPANTVWSEQRAAWQQCKMALETARKAKGKAHE